jgi:formate dehydrogenase subunit gamma
MTDDALDSGHLARVGELLSLHRDTPGALLPLLHAVQDALGYVPPETVPLIAERLNLSRAEVHGVVSYYHFFRHAAPGRRVVQICRAESCQACGADELLAHAERLFGCKANETRADGAVSLEPVYCLGLCALSPAIMIDERLHASMTPQKLAKLAARMEPVA